MRYIHITNIYKTMFYSDNTTQDYFELWVVIALMVNLMVFFIITFKPGVLRGLSAWATRMVDRVWKGVSSNH